MKSRSPRRWGAGSPGPRSGRGWVGRRQRKHRKSPWRSWSGLAKVGRRRLVARRHRVHPEGDARLYPPPPEFQRQAHIKSLEEYRALYKRSIEDPEGFWGEQAKAALVAAVGPRPRLEAALREVVRRRQDQRLRQLPRPPPRGRRKNKAAIIWEGEPGDTRDAHLPGAAARGLPVRQRAARASASSKGDRVAHLHADGPRGGDRDAGLRAHRRDPHASSSAASQPEALRDRINDAEREARHHRRRRLPPRQGRAAQGATSTRRSQGAAAVRARASSSSAPASTMRDAGRAATTGGTSVDGGRLRATARPSRWTPSTRSSSSTPVGHHRQAQGHPAHDRRLPARHAT